jgi:2-methylcitrate dehydratase PrpD
MDAVSLFTKNIVDKNYQDLPPEVVAATKTQILDTLGVMIAGSMSEDNKRLMSLMKEWGGKAESTIFGFGGKIPCGNAAFINGFSASVLDYDDVNALDSIHCSRGVIPAAFAVAERKATVNGRDFITAICLSYDMACRMSRAVIRKEEAEEKNTLTHLAHTETGLLTAPNVFGAAAVAGKILGLNEEQLKNAFGIALLQIGTEGQAIREGLNTKGLDFAFRPRAGVFAALAAERGLVGTADPIDGQWGFFAQYYKNVYSPKLLTKDLGSTFAVTNNVQRLYPCCGTNGIAITAALNLANEYDIKPDELDEVMLNVGPVTDWLCEPLDKKRRPANPIEAQYSIPWAVAKALVYRKVGLEHFTIQQTKDKRTIDMADKINVKLIPDFRQTTVGSHEPVIIDVKTKSGAKYTKRADFTHGDLNDPMSFSDVVVKFKDCCKHSAQPISKEYQEKVVAMVDGLENIRDIGQITSLLG